MSDAKNKSVTVDGVEYVPKRLLDESMARESHLRASYEAIRKAVLANGPPLLIRADVEDARRMLADLENHEILEEPAAGTFLGIGTAALCLLRHEGGGPKVWAYNPVRYSVADLRSWKARGGGR